MSESYSTDDFEADNPIARIERTFDESARQLEVCQLALIRQFFEVRPAGMVQPGTFIITPGHQPMSNEYGDDELRGESTSVSDYSMEEDDLETHEIINIDPLVASILNPDPRQPARSVAPLSILLGVNTSSHVIQMSRSSVAATVEAIRQRQYMMRVKAESDRQTAAIERQIADMRDASLQRTRAMAAQAKQAEQNLLAWKREFERERSLDAKEVSDLIAMIEGISSVPLVSLSKSHAPSNATALPDIEMAGEPME